MQEKSLKGKFNFTEANLKQLSPKKKQYDVYDALVSGLSLRISPGGSKTFNFVKKINGRFIRLKIGDLTNTTLKTARTLAISYVTAYSFGEDPREEKKAKKEELMFTDIYESFYAHHVMRTNKYPALERRVAELSFLPLFARNTLKEITLDKVRKLHLEIANSRGKRIANRSINALSVVFNFAIREGMWNGNNPCNGVLKFPEQSRDRFLNEEELDIFFKSLEKEDEIYQDYFKLLLYTGARKTNVLKMKYKDIDFSIKRWRISELESKNKTVNIIPLSDPALEILERRKSINNSLENPSAFVFSSTIGTRGHLVDPKKAFARIKRSMGVDDFTMHDLRRTLGSYMAIDGASLPIISKALNHKNQRSTLVYARLSQEPVLEAVNSAILRMQRKK